jgi:hypothetical protein
MDFATFILSQTIGIASHALIGKSTYNAVRFVGDNTFKLFGIKDTMTSADGYFYSYDAFARSTALMISHDAPIVAFSYFALGTTIDPRVIALKYAITLLWSYAAADETDLGRQAKLDSIIIKEMAGVIPIDKVLEGAKNFAEKPLETLSFGAKQIGTSAVNTIISLIQNIYIMSILGGTTALCSTTIDSLNESDKNSFYKKYIAKHSIIKNLFEGTLKSSFVYGTHIILRESVAWYTGKAIADPDLLARFAGTAMFYTLMPKETFNFIDRSSFDVAGALPDIMSIFSEMA